MICWKDSGLRKTAILMVLIYYRGRIKINLSKGENQRGKDWKNQWCPHHMAHVRTRSILPVHMTTRPQTFTQASESTVTWMTDLSYSDSFPHTLSEQKWGFTIHHRVRMNLLGLTGRTWLNASGIQKRAFTKTTVWPNASVTQNCSSQAEYTKGHRVTSRSLPKVRPEDRPCTEMCSSGLLSEPFLPSNVLTQGTIEKWGRACFSLPAVSSHT